MKQTICDYCGNIIKEEFKDYRGDLAKDTLACIKIEPTLLNKSVHVIHNPDLCRKCIIKVLRG